jgi:hypothetical protein
MVSPILRSWLELRGERQMLVRIRRLVQDASVLWKP